MSSSKVFHICFDGKLHLMVYTTLIVISPAYSSTPCVPTFTHLIRQLHTLAQLMHDYKQKLSSRYLYNFRPITVK